MPTAFVRAGPPGYCPGTVHPSGTVGAVFVKICGITTEEDALLAVALGADALGFVFASGSPRQVRVRRSRTSSTASRPGTTTVGVFRDERRERVVEVVHSIGLTGAQLHGREHPSEVRWVAERVPFVIQAFPAGDPAPRPGGGRAAPARCSSTRPSRGRARSSTGPSPRAPPRGCGSCSPAASTTHNVGDAIRAGAPLGRRRVDGVETEPGSGRKDPVKLRRFIEAAREAGEAVADGRLEPAPGRRRVALRLADRAARHYQNPGRTLAGHP